MLVKTVQGTVYLNFPKKGREKCFDVCKIRPFENNERWLCRLSFDTGFKGLENHLTFKSLNLLYFISVNPISAVTLALLPYSRGEII